MDRISIHAPVKGATIGTLSEAEEVEISIHAPVKGATELAQAYQAYVEEFQSTRP